MPRRPRRILAATLLSLGVLAAMLGPAGAASGGTSRQILVSQVNGLIDPANASLIVRTIRSANASHATLLVIQVDSGGAVDADLAPMVRAIEHSSVPIAVWVGPSGAKAKGAAAVLTTAAPIASISQGSSIGPAAPVFLDHPATPSRRDTSSTLTANARRNGRSASGTRVLVGRSLSATQARARDAVDLVVPTLGELVVSLDGRTVRTAAGPVKLSTARVVGTGQQRRREPNQTVVFRKLGLGATVVHTLTSPSIAYLLFVAGLALIVFEFFTISIGLAGATGALALVGSLAGLSHLPVHWWALALVTVGVLGFTIDVQAGRLGAWTFIGAASLVVGSVLLFGGSSRLDPPWWVLVLVVLGLVAFMVGGVPAAIRARFSTPTIGREGMVGEMGRAEVDVAPEGVVTIRDALWRARTNRATPIRAGQSARVVAVEGLVLEVEPEEGGARDYRERRTHPEPET